MKKNEARKPVKLSVHLNPLKLLIEHSHTSRAHYQVKAMLQSHQQKGIGPIQSPTLGAARAKHQDALSAMMSQKAEPVQRAVEGRQHSDLQRKGTTKSNNKGSSESTNELTETLATMKSPDHVKQLILRLNLLRRYKVNREETEEEDIDKIIYNDRAHVVARFKDYLIYDDIKELVQEYHKSIESMYLLHKLGAVQSEKIRPCDVVLEEYQILKKAKQKKEKIQRLKEGEKGKDEDGSTFFRTAFMNSLAKEDLSNSLSKLPSNSLECEDDEDSHKILELLKELNSKDVTLVIRKTHKEPEKVRQSVQAKKVVEEVKKPCVEKRTKCVLRAPQNKTRPTTTMQFQPKAISPSPYFVSQRTVKAPPGSVSKMDSTLKQDSSIGASSIDNLSKNIMRKLHVAMKDAKDSTVVTLKGTKRSQNGEEQLKSMEVLAHCTSKHKEPLDDSKRSNYFTIYDARSHLPSKPTSSREIYNIVKSPISARNINSKEAPSKSKNTARAQQQDSKKKKQVTKNALQESIESLLSRSAQVARIVKLGAGLCKKMAPAKPSKLLVQPKLLRSTPELGLTSKLPRYVQKCFSPGNIGKGSKLG